QLALAERAKSLDMAFRHATEQADIREQEIIWCLAQAMASRDGNTGDHIEQGSGEIDVATLDAVEAEAFGDQLGDIGDA
ncbi:hypothetical protein ACC718_39355, partial [Rhizobium ruizarguesonis]